MSFSHEPSFARVKSRPKPSRESNISSEVDHLLNNSFEYTKEESTSRLRFEELRALREAMNARNLELQECMSNLKAKEKENIQLQE